jgi:hypothetical protein
MLGNSKRQVAMKGEEGIIKLYVHPGCGAIRKQDNKQLQWVLFLVSSFIL